MKASINWLSALGGLKLDAAEVAELYTMAGLEIEGRVAFGDFSGVVVAEVRKRSPHPNANKLTLVEVFDGSSTTQVVCGAPNVPDVGGLVCWAKPGATLPMGEGGAAITIGAKEVRGVSSPGMLCAEDELGLGTSHEGILILSLTDGMKPGDDLARVLGFPDAILEVNVTPNRSDCLGHVGLLRELGAIFQARGQALGQAGPKLPAPLAAGAASGGPGVEILDAEGCPRYSASLVRGLTVGRSPLRDRLRLAGLGVRPISNVVDVTNLLMMKFGQPLHAFDADRLEGGRVVIRRARTGEKLHTLDGQERALEPDDVVICDAVRPVALGGVMGGRDSEVNAATRNVLIEVATFAPALIRRTAKRLGLHSEASHRFERGTDFDRIAEVNVAAGAEMVRLGGGTAGPLTDQVARPLQRRTVALRPSRTDQLLGTSIEPKRQAALLGSLGLQVTVGAQIAAQIPAFRPDLEREVDLVEEVARLYGYAALPTTVPALHTMPPRVAQDPEERAREILCGMGLDEVISFAFVAPHELETFFADDRKTAIRVGNPLREEQSAMRTSLLPGLVAAAARNVARRETNFGIFEVGRSFRSAPEGGGAPSPALERTHVAAAITGHTAGWLTPGAAVDVFDCKRLVEALVGPLRVESSRERYLHPGAQGQVVVGKAAVGVFGQLHPDLVRTYDLDQPVFVFEIDLDALPEPNAVRFTELGRHPAVERDVSFFIDEKVTSQSIGDVIDAIKSTLLIDFAVREDYRESGRVPAGKKGMLWSFTYRAPDRTLTDAEVQAAHDALVKGLSAKLILTLR